jgi:hypothetical protein
VRQGLLRLGAGTRTFATPMSAVDRLRRYFESLAKLTDGQRRKRVVHEWPLPNLHFSVNFGNAIRNDKGLYELTAKMTGPNGRVAVVKTVWEKIGETTYKLVTAQPN